MPPPSNESVSLHYQCIETAAGVIMFCVCLLKMLKQQVITNQDIDLIIRMIFKISVMENICF